MSFLNVLGKERLYLDGAMGSMLQKKLADIGQNPETLCITNKSLITDIHKAYVDAGADIIITSSFGANAFKLKDSAYSVKEVMAAAVQCARDAHPRFVALDIGPVGALVGDLGNMPFETAYDYFSESIQAGVACGVDLILLETFTDIYEMKAAILAAKENSDLPIIASMTYENNGRTLTGSTPEAVVTILEGLGVDAISINCSTGPIEMVPIVEKLIQHASIPIVVEPNAGLPKMVGEETIYDITPEMFTATMAEMAKMGVAVLGGCCGTTPEYIKSLVNATKDIKIPPIKKNKEQLATCVASSTKNLVIGDDIHVIGECINPTTNKALKEALRRGDLGIVQKLAIEQKKAGAAILDVNVGLPDLDEKETMLKVVAAISAVCDLPLQIDSSDPEVLEAVLRKINGKPIINSVNGDEKVLNKILPLAHKYGACVLGLTMDHKGIPKTTKERVDMASFIISAAKKQGIPQKNILIDALVLTVSAQQKQVKETLNAVQQIKAQFNVPIVLGVSNISFGLPDRLLLNRTYLNLAMAKGLDTPILNPLDQQMMDTILAFRVFNSNDQNALEYVAKHQESNPNHAQKAERDKVDLKDLVIEGRKKEVMVMVEKMLKEHVNSMDIVNHYLIPGLDVVGKQFESGDAFLPNLIYAGEAVQAAFDLIKETLSSADQQISKGKILLATVDGDVHDIGKNIVKVLLENYGYTIVDLGKNVPIEAILTAIKAHDIRLVGLSALMTTTVKNMGKAIQEIHKIDPKVSVMVGGAVLNPEYAQQIGADYYGKDAKTAVDIAKAYFNTKKESL